MSSFEILSATKKEGLDDKPFNVWIVEFKGEQGAGTAEMVRNKDRPAPSGTVDAEIEHGQYGAKLKEARKGGSNGFRGGGGKSPQERAEIRRMASQKVAVELLALEVASGLKFSEQHTAGSMLKTRIDWLDGDVREAGERA